MRRLAVFLAVNNRALAGPGRNASHGKRVRTKMKIMMRVALVLFIVLALTSCNSLPEEKPNNAASQAGAESGQKPAATDKALFLDEGSVKAGDRLGELQVKSVDVQDGMVTEASFAGRITITGTYRWFMESGITEVCYITPDEASARRLPG